METMRLVIGLLSCFGVAHAEGKQCVVAQPVALAPAKVKAPPCHRAPKKIELGLWRARRRSDGTYDARGIIYRGDSMTHRAAAVPHEQASGGVALPELDKVRARITGWDAREGAKSIEDAAAAYLAECK